MFREFEQINRNLWKRNGTYYRLYSVGVTPNGCWLIAPKMVELADIDISTGKDVYGAQAVHFSVAGDVPSIYESITYRTDKN